MEFILAQLSILIWLSQYHSYWQNFQLSGWIFSYPVGLGTALFLPKRNSNIACLLSLCKASPISLQQHSLRAAIANIIKCPANTLLPRRTHMRTHKQTHIQNRRYLLSTHFFSPLLSSWLSLSGSARGKECALICQSEQPFHRESVCGTPVPEWELLISPGCLAYSRLVGSPRWKGTERVRALVRAWQVADKSASCCSCMHSPLLLELSLSCSVFCTVTCTYT